MLYNLFPTFKVVEINNVAALRMGHVIAQTPLYSVDEASDKGITYVKKGAEVVAKFLENGVIVGHSGKELKAYDSSVHVQPCLVYTEELITADMTGGLDQFANQFEGNVVYPRALPLNLGETFTTNNYSGTVADEGYATVTNGVITLSGNARSGAMFYYKKSDLPAGQDAIECTYIGYKA